MSDAAKPFTNLSRVHPGMKFLVWHGSDPSGFGAQPVLVERNGTALFPRDFPATELADKDVIEVIRIVAGG